MSLEWVDANRDSVKILEFILNIDYSQERGSGDRFSFQTQDKLLEAVQELYGIIKKDS